MKTIQELMREPRHTCYKHESLEIVSEQMRSNELNTLIVLDSEQVVVGTLSYLDACLASLSLDKLQSEILVAEVMSRSILTINTHDDEKLALNLMRQFQRNTLTVVDQENKIKGSIHFMTLARRIISFKRRFKSQLQPQFQVELV